MQCSHTYVAFVVFSLVFVSCAGCNSTDAQLAFDSTVWKNGGPEIRGKMVCDLLGIEHGDWRSTANHLSSASRLEGRSEAETRQLLGMPDGSFAFGRVLGPKDACATMNTYRIGYLDENGPLDNEFSLVVGFDSRGRVSLVYISD